MAQSSLDRFFADILDKYDVTPEEYRAMYRAQGGRCYICRRADGSKRRLGVDHDHLSSEVRALLCTGSRDPKTCNRLIGFYNRAQLLRAVDVLSDPPPARSVLSVLRDPNREPDPLIPSLVGNPAFRLHEVLR